MVALLLTGCTTRYTAKAAALEEARQVAHAPLPVERGGRPHWLDPHAVVAERPIPGDRIELTARDGRRSLAAAGAAAGGRGPVALVGGLLTAGSAEEAVSLGAAVADGTGGTMLAIAGGALLTGGLAAMIAAGVSDGPELPPPAASALPPRR